MATSTGGENPGVPRIVRAYCESPYTVNFGQSRSCRKHAAGIFINLTDEQKKQCQKAQKAVQAIRRQARGKFLALLTPEQKKQVAGPRKPNAKKKKT